MAAVNDGEDDEEHADLLRRGGNQLGNEDVFHLRLGVGSEPLPALDFVGNDDRIGTRRKAHQHGIHAAGLRRAGLRRFEQSRHRGG